MRNFIQEKSLNVPNFLSDVQTDLSDSRVEDHVIRNVHGKHGTKQIADLKKRILEERRDTLFFIVHDEAHYAPLQNNLLDTFVNDQEISEAPNVILLQVSATPYCLVTKNTRIPAENRTNWFKTEDAGEYFGIKVVID